MPAPNRTRSRCTSHASGRSLRRWVSGDSSIPFVASVTDSTRRDEMRLFRILPATAVIAAALSFAGVAPASAMVLWCESDPPIQLVTPAGTNITGNNQIYAPRDAMHLSPPLPASAPALSDGHGGALPPRALPSPRGGLPWL